MAEKKKESSKKKETSFIRRNILEVIQISNMALSLVAAVLLLVAAFTYQDYSYYTFLRWYIFILSAYSILGLLVEIKKTNFIGIIFAILCTAGIGILFNPLHIVTFQRSTWKIIDLVFGVLFIFGIITRISDTFKQFLKKIDDIHEYLSDTKNVPIDEKPSYIEGETTGGRVIGERGEPTYTEGEDVVEYAKRLGAWLKEHPEARPKMKEGVKSAPGKGLNRN